MRCSLGSLAAAAVAVAFSATGVDAFVKGHDLSSAGLMETEQGATWYSTSGKASALEDILGAGGMDSVRLRCVRCFDGFGNWPSSN